MNDITARDRLIFALDVASALEAEHLAKTLASHVGMFKVGLELFTGEGPALVEKLVGRGSKVFLDLKLHDIPTTVERTAILASRMRVHFLTVHATGGPRMLQAAVRGAREGAGTGREPARILAVTVLTSMEENDLRDVGLEGPSLAAGERLAVLADKAGCHGVIASPREAAQIRAATRDGFQIVTPGIRPSGSAADDQSRNDTPAAAIEGGADYLVVGRPIRDAADPAKAADDIVAEIERALPKAKAG